jgi:hypothetical protein
MADVRISAPKSLERYRPENFGGAQNGLGATGVRSQYDRADFIGETFSFIWHEEARCVAFLERFS